MRSFPSFLPSPPPSDRSGRRRGAALASAVMILASLLGLAACSPPPAEEVEVAVLLPLTGAWQVYGEPIRRGIELAHEEWSGGHPRWAVELTVLDTASDPTRAARLLAENFEAGAMAALGGVTSAEALAMAPVADAARRVLLSPSASSPELSGISPWFFRVFPSDLREGTRMARFVAENLRLVSVVVLTTDTPYARGISRVFVEELQRLGRPTPEVITYPAGSEDFSQVVQKALAEDPQALFVADFAEPVRRILTEAKARGFAGKLLTTSAFNAPEVLAAADGVAEDVILTQTAFEPGALPPAEPGETSLAARFVDSYRQRWGEDPGTFAAHGYDAFRMLGEGLLRARGRRSGGVGNPPALAVALRRSLASVEISGVTGRLTFDPAGDVEQQPQVVVFQDGRFQDYDRLREEYRRRLFERLRQLRRPEPPEAGEEASDGPVDDAETAAEG